MDQLQEFYEKVIVKGDPAYYPTFDELTEIEKIKLKNSLSFFSFIQQKAVANFKSELNNFLSKIGLKLR